MTDELAALLAEADPVALGQRIRQARLKLDITQGELAGGHASVGYVSRIEAGKRRPDVGVLEGLAARLKTTSLALLTGAPDPTETRILLALEQAEFQLRGGEPQSADALLRGIGGEVATAPQPELGRRWRFISALTNEALGNLDDAIVLLEDFLAEETDKTEVTRAAVALSRCYRESGDFTRAIETGQRCLDGLKRLGLDATDDAVQLAVTVAAAHFTLGDTAHAVRLCRRAMEVAEEMGTPVARASAYWNASVMESERGAPEAAVPLAQKALQLLDAVEGNRNLARLRSQLGIYQLRLDPPDVEGARSNLESAHSQFEWSSASPVDRGRNTVALAKADLISGSPATALEAARGVLAEVRDSAPLLAVEAFTVMGQAAFVVGDSQAATQHYRDAVGVLSGIGSDKAAAAAWFELGALLDELGLASEAHDAYRSAAVSTGLMPMPALRQVNATR